MEIHDKIVHAALRVVAETGYRGATTRRIAQEADVNEVTLFRHFGSKDELIRAALRCAVDQDLIPTLPDSPRHPERELNEWAALHYARLTQRRAMILTCMGESAEHPEMAECVRPGPLRVRDELRRYFGALQRAGLAGEFDIDAAVALLMGALFADAMSRALHPDLFAAPVAVAPASYVQLLLRAIGVQSSSQPV